ncbi:hypothetical protein [Helicobacter pylori]|uniref:hypothetical protein n=1 Tax=Helicobacter pylori TaxID=210 RepID=UPI000EADE6A3|nr:hypothetical protein [Helicobacter pylori]
MENLPNTDLALNETQRKELIKNIQNALNHDDFKEQVYLSLEGVMEIIKALNGWSNGVNYSNMRFVGYYLNGEQKFIHNTSANFSEIFELKNNTLGYLENDKIYSLFFSMPYELQARYNEFNQGELILGVKSSNAVHPISSSFWQVKSDLVFNNHRTDTYRVNCVFKTPESGENLKLAVFGRQLNNLWTNPNYSPSQGLGAGYILNASFNNLETKAIPGAFSNDNVFYKKIYCVVYEILN